MIPSPERRAERGLPLIVPHQERPSSPEKLKPGNLVVVTDVEGPLILGDTYLSVMAKYINPEYDSEAGHGLELFEETYHWFLRSQFRNGFGQDGSDIVCHVGPMLLYGVTDEMILEEARKSRPAPGAKEYIDFLKSLKTKGDAREAVVVGITTAWDAPHRSIVLDNVGLDGMIGTQFSLAQAKQELIDSGKWDGEMAITREFVTDCNHLITKRHWASGRVRERLSADLQQRINHFYVDELGLTWNEEGDMVPSNPRLGFKTELAEIMQKLHVVGDKRKARIARAIFDNYARAGAVRIAIGDGLNDAHMLRETPWSIGINGAAAANAAAIGLITKDVKVLIEITELIMDKQREGRRLFGYAYEVSDDDVSDVVEAAQIMLGDRAIVIVGGRNNPLSTNVLEQFKIAKLEWRGIDASKTA